jgi:acyl-CoA synthetase (AMP-forming)/AMP-acid ligase II
MIDYNTLTEGFLDQTDTQKGVYHVRGEDHMDFVSYHDLQVHAKSLLGHLQHIGMQPKDELIIAAGNNHQFLDAFWASILGGIVPVPVSMGISDEHRAKIFRIFNKLKNPYLLVERSNLDRLAAFAAKQGLQEAYQQLAGRAVIIDEIEELSVSGTVHAADPQDTALIQFSSGSTSEPKGVVLTHHNLVSNVRDILNGIQVTKEDSTVSWMPLTHDMGLIGIHICELMMGLNQHPMPTELFV